MTGPNGETVQTTVRAVKELLDVHGHLYSMSNAELAIFVDGSVIEIGVKRLWGNLEHDY